MKIQLKSVNYATHKAGEIITSPADITRAEAQRLVRRGWAFLLEGDPDGPVKSENDNLLELDYNELKALASGKGFDKKQHGNASKENLIKFLKNVEV